MAKQLAFLISRLLGPLPMACLLWLIVTLKSGIGFYKALWVYPLIFFINIAIPTVITTYLIAIKKVESLEWKNLTERKKYLPPVALFSITFLSLLTYFLTNQTVFHLGLLLSANVLILLGIWTFLNYKISGHIAVATITFACVNLYFHQQFVWLYLLIPILIWARYTLKVHTLGQLISGFVVPAVIMFIALWLFGYPSVP